VAPVRAVFFDLDGVLIDSLPDMTAAVNRSLARYGFPPLVPAEVVAFVGHGARNLLHNSHVWSRQKAGAAPAPAAGSAEFNAILAAYIEYYRDNCADCTVLYPGAAELLAFLRDAGIPGALISNKPYAVTVGVLDKLGVRAFFAAVVDPDKVARIKPAPDALHAALAVINAQRRAASLPPLVPADCLMVGDTDSDISAGRAFGARTVAVTQGYGDQKALLAQNADYVVGYAGEIVKLFTKIDNTR
jgi:phosphoglycolate phosphatase